MNFRRFRHFASRKNNLIISDFRGGRGGATHKKPTHYESRVESSSEFKEFREFISLNSLNSLNSLSSLNAQISLIITTFPSMFSSKKSRKCLVV